MAPANYGMSCHRMSFNAIAFEVFSGFGWLSQLSIEQNNLEAFWRLGLKNNESNICHRDWEYAPGVANLLDGRPGFPRTHQFCPLAIHVAVCQGTVASFMIMLCLTLRKHRRSSPEPPTPLQAATGPAASGAPPTCSSPWPCVALCSF